MLGQQWLGASNHSLGHDRLCISKDQLDLLLKFVGPERLLFGTDVPFAPRKSIDTFTRYLGGYEIDERAREAINRGNALKMFPRLGGK